MDSEMCVRMQKKELSDIASSHLSYSPQGNRPWARLWVSEVQWQQRHIPCLLRDGISSTRVMKSYSQGWSW